MPKSDLIEGQFIILYDSLARKIGLNEAVVVQKLAFLLDLPGGRDINGEHWIFNTYEQWQAEHFPWWSIRTIKSIFTQLEQMLIIEACQPDGAMSRKKYYRLNHGMRARLLSGTLDFPHSANFAPSTVQILPHPQHSTHNIEKTEETKETIGMQNAVFKPDQRSKEEQLRNLSVPRQYPDQATFDAFIAENAPLISDHRPDLYLTLCGAKWHRWDQKHNRWLRIRKWQSYLMALETKIEQANG